MSYSTNLGYSNAVFRQSLGWFEPSNIIEISDVGTYSKIIVPYENNSTDLKVMKILKKENQSYYTISFRQPIGLDKKREGNYGYYDGIEIHMRGHFLGNAMNRSWLIDPISGDEYNNTFKKGESYEGIIDDNTGVLITVEDIYRDYEKPENSRATIGIKIYKK